MSCEESVIGMASLHFVLHLTAVYDLLAVTFSQSAAVHVETLHPNMVCTVLA